MTADVLRDIFGQERLLIHGVCPRDWICLAKSIGRLHEQKMKEQVARLGMHESGARCQGLALENG